MRTRLVILIIVLLHTNVLWSENLFSYYVGHDLDILSAVPTSEGGSIAAGRIFVAGQNYDAVLVKLNSLGKAEWKTRLGGKKYEIFEGIVALGDSAYVAVGHTTTFVSPKPFVSSDILIIRFDRTGKIIWRKTIGGSGEERAVSVTPTSDSGVVLLAYTNSFGDPDPLLDTFSDFLIIKLNSSGQIQWSLNLAVPGDDHPISSIALKDGSILLGGHGQGFTLVKINENGKILWSRKLNELSIFRTMTQLQNGNILLSGWENDLSGNSVLVKINSSGTVLWSKRLTANNQSVDIGTLLADDSGGAFISASTQDDRTLFLRINNLGIVQWQKIFDIGTSENPRNLLELSTGGILFIGGAYDFRGFLRTVIVGFTQSGDMESCYSEISSVQLKSIGVHSKKFAIKAERNLRFRVTSPRLTFAQPNLPFETICP